MIDGEGGGNAAHNPPLAAKTLRNMSGSDLRHSTCMLMRGVDADECAPQALAEHVWRGAWRALGAAQAAQAAGHVRSQAKPPNAVQRSAAAAPVCA